MLMWIYCPIKLDVYPHRTHSNATSEGNRKIEEKLGYKMKFHTQKQGTAVPNVKSFMYSDEWERDV